MSETKPMDQETIQVIRQKIQGYIEAWYTGIPEKGEKSLHPELVKRIALKDSESGKDYLNRMSAAELMDRWRSKDGTKTPEASQVYDISILDIHGHIASAKLETPAWVDYMHLGKINGEWVIVNILWERKP